MFEEIGDEVSVEGLICQAAQAIDIAGRLAAEQRDTGRMLQTVEVCTKLADFIVALSEHQSKKNKEKSEIPMGFQSSQASEPVEEEHDIMAEEEENVRDDTD